MVTIKLFVPLVFNVHSTFSPIIDGVRGESLDLWAASGTGKACFTARPPSGGSFQAQWEDTGIDFPSMR
mgnify:FL=1